jgi:hypothetical protein
MDKHSTKDHLAQFESLAFKYLQFYTDQQIADLAKNSKLPICYYTHDKLLRVGKYTITTNLLDIIVTSETSDRTLTFSTKSSAFFYCFNEQKGRYKISDEIILHDERVQRHLREFKLRKTQLNNKTLSSWKYELYLAKYSDVRAKLADAQNELRKVLQIAKYYKF